MKLSNFVERQKGFTLIELLVVIAIIALLMSVILPALKRVKEAAKRATCLSNVKSLSVAYLLYCDDNEGRLPLGCGGTVEEKENAWCELVEEPYTREPLKAPEELQEDAIMRGVLYPYLETVEVYRCPVAKKHELRTYSISTAMNFPSEFEWALEGHGGTIIKKITQVQSSGSRMLFLDDYGVNWNSSWYVPATLTQWWNPTPIRHGSGGNVFSFLDGSANYHAWKDRRTIALAELCAEAETPNALDKAGNAPGEQSDNEDLIWAARAQWGKLKKEKTR